MSIPPTNATSPSTITSFSWWQCSRALARVARRADLRAAHELVARVARRGAVGGEVWRGAPAHISTRTSTRSAESREQFAQEDGRLVAREGEVRRDDQPAMWTWRRAPRIARAISGSACAPSTRTRARCPPAAAGPRPPTAPRPVGRSARHGRGCAAGGGGGRPSRPRSARPRGGRRWRVRAWASPRYPARQATISR